MRMSYWCSDLFSSDLWFAEEGKRMYGDVMPGHQSDKRIVVLRQPIGVVAAITPWNFPSAMLGRKIGPAMTAGCTIVCQPALQTPNSALAFSDNRGATCTERVCTYREISGWVTS